jgi:AhpD family alkylhydroperoxidase
MLLMARDQERLERSHEEPIVGGLPDVPGILTALRLTPNLGIHLRGLTDELLVNDFPAATLVRAEREMLATAVSAANDCFFCMDSHAAHATALLEVTGLTNGTVRCYPTASRRVRLRLVRGRQ